MPKLTKKFVESIVPNSSKQLKFWDSEIKGFGVVVLPSGRKTYCIEYRNLDRVKKRLKIGVHGQITAENARNMARKHLAHVIHGYDPNQERKEFAEKITMDILIQEYLSNHAYKKRPKSIIEDKRLIDLYILPNFSGKKIEFMTRKEIGQLHTKLSKIPYQANRVLALLSKMFSLAITWGYIKENPVHGIERYQEEKRERWLNSKEMEQFWEVLNEYPKNVTALLVKFLLLTGARKGEAMNAMWEHFDLQKGVWTKPSHLTKQKKTEHLPLSTQALDVLMELKSIASNDSKFVFPGRVSGEPLKEMKTFWKTLLKKTRIENLRIHDLRHTHASHLVSSGLSLSIVGKLLGHTQAATTQRYAHLADEPLREAAELFGKKVEKREGK